MTKILITGFRHSGTTMTHQLIKAHPQVGWIEDEEGYIDFDKPKEWVLMMAKKRVDNLKKNSWGEKLPWGDRKTDKNCKRAINFSNKWLKYFGSQARIIHVLRHPIDVFLSGGRQVEKITSKHLAQITSSVSKYIEFLNTDNRCATIVYEDLLMEPKQNLKEIFYFLNLNVNEKIIDSVLNTKLKFGKINPDRAYAFSKRDIDFEVINYLDIQKKIKNVL